jgi:uracil phosphoribosyltransferase
VFTLHVVDHPLIADRVRELRDKQTPRAEFLRLTFEVTQFLTYEAFRDLPTVKSTVDTPVADGAPAFAVEREYVIVPILRAGLGMCPAVQAVLPKNRVCLVGLRRDETTLQPSLYLDGLPEDLAGVSVIVCDPMLATGGSLVRALDLIHERGANDVTVLCLIASAPGVAFVRMHHGDARIVCAALDAELNDAGFITPGLGDAGDRLFGPGVAGSSLH